MKSVTISPVVFLVVIGGAYGAGIVMKYHTWISLLLLAGLAIVGLVKISGVLKKG